MVPLLMHFKVRRPGHNAFGLYFPVILIWILLAALLIVLLPFVLLAALLTRQRGPGRMLLLLYPMTAAVLWNMSGLHIETNNKENELLIDFQ
jgi:predicted exporter